ncbi:MAG: M20/M25/M40 family metallo-hydrolase [Oligoflexia bacterium]|nr:M20/M25/M40 family metallo-hydrolase [Oligoflexia bacterium]
MKLITFLATLLLSQLIVANPEKLLSDNPRYFIIPNEALAALQQQAAPYIKMKGPWLSLVALNPTQANKLSYLVHELYNKCGGFLDIQNKLDQGLTPEQALSWAHYQARSKRIRNNLPQTPQYPQHVELLYKNLNSQRTLAYLQELVSFPDRYSRGEGGVKTTQFLAQRAKELSMKFNRPDVSITIIPTGSWYKQDSVLVRIPGKNSSLAGVLIGGHMDTYNNQKPGADDDGSGTVSVQELLTGVLQSGLKFNRDIYFAYYAAEEQGLHGSARMVEEFQKRKVALRGVMQFDMTGFKSPKDKFDMYLINDYVDQNLNAFLKKLIDAYVKVSVGLTKCGYACSDHASWHNADYPSSFPFEASFENDNKTIHSGNDKIELLNLNHMMNFVKLGAAFIVELGEPISN